MSDKRPYVTKNWLSPDVRSRMYLDESRKELPMKTVGLFQAKQRLSELVEEAGRGQSVGITRRGVLRAVLVPAPGNPKRPLADVFASLRGSIELPKYLKTKDLIEEGRRL
jgi:prevent-host-death family protein